MILYCANKTFYQKCSYAKMSFTYLFNYWKHISQKKIPRQKRKRKKKKKKNPNFTILSTTYISTKTFQIFECISHYSVFVVFFTLKMNKSNVYNNLSTVESFIPIRIQKPPFLNFFKRSIFKIQPPIPKLFSSYKITKLNGIMITKASIDSKFY